MEPTQEQKSNEQLKPEEIVVPKETAMALGRGLNQLLGPQLEQIRPYIDNLTENPQVDQSYVQEIRKAISRILTIPDSLEHAKETKVVSFSIGFDFAFSEERATEGQPPIQSELIIDETTVPKLSHLKSVMQQNFNNTLNAISGFSELIQDSAEDSHVSNQAKSIYSVAQLIHGVINPIQTVHHQLKISTDATGNTTITPMPYLASRPIK